MLYREPLPDNCPPDTAEEINAPRTVYRLVRNNPTTDDDFRFQRSEQPERIFRDVTECQARGLSVFVSLTSPCVCQQEEGYRGWQSAK